jgi:hypothetical protein
MKPQPVLIGGLLNILAVAAAAFGLDLTTEQLAGFVAVVTTIVSLVQRHQVRPVSTSVDR